MWRRPIDAIVGLACCLLLASCVFAININDLPWEVRNALKPVHIDWGIEESDLQAVPGIRNVADLQPSKPQRGPLVVTPGPMTIEGAGGLRMDTGGEFGGVEVGRTGPGVLKAVEQSAGDKDLEGFDPRVLAIGGKCADTIRQENMSIEEFVAWTHENNLTRDDIVAAMQYSGIDWPQLDVESMPLAAALLDRMGDDLEGLEEIPMIGRLLLAIYLGKLGREDDVRKVYAAISDEELLAHRLRDLHGVNSHIWQDAPLVTLDILKRYGAVLSERRLLCTIVRAVCNRIGDKTIVEKELIPFAEAALESMPPTDYWTGALSTLIWAYQHLGDDESALREGLKWLQDVKNLGIDTDSAKALHVKMRLAQSCARMGRYEEAADMLRAVIGRAPVDSWVANAAQAELMKIAKVHPDIGEVELLPARFRMTRPDRLNVRVRLGEQVIYAITVIGNLTFKVTAAQCQLPFVESAVGKRESSDRGSSQAVGLSIKPTEKVGEQRGTLTVQTNDAERPSVEIPITVEVLSPAVVRPDNFLFGSVKPGETKTVTLTLTFKVPFEIGDIKVDKPEHLAVEVVGQAQNSYLVKATLHAPDQPGTIKGNIEVSTNLKSAPVVSIPYHAQVTKDVAGPAPE